MNLVEPTLLTWIFFIVVFAIPSFFLFRWLLPKLIKFEPGVGLNIAAGILGLMLSPFLGYGAFVVYDIQTGFHG